MLILLISSAMLTEHQWVMERGRESWMREGLKFLPKRDIKKDGGRGIESGRGAELYDRQLKAAKVEEKMKERGKIEILSLPLHSFVLSSFLIHPISLFACVPLAPSLPLYKNSVIVLQT